MAFDRRGARFRLVVGGIVAAVVLLTTGVGLVLAARLEASGGDLSQDGGASLAAGPVGGLVPEAGEAATAPTTATAGAPGGTTPTARPAGAAATASTSAATIAAPSGQDPLLPPVTMPVRPPGGVAGTVPGAVDLPFAAGQSQWSATVNGVDLRMQASTGTPEAGKPVSFQLSADHDSLACCLLYVDFGDGGRYRAESSGPPSSCLGQPYPWTRLTRTTTYTFNKPGRWQVLFFATVVGCSPSQQLTGGEPTRVPEAGFTAWIEVAPGVSTAQGPALPTIGGGPLVAGVPPYRSDAAQGDLALFGELADADGYLRRVQVDWGDGSPVQTFDLTAGRPCVVSASGWPTSTVMWGLVPQPPASHHYAHPGTYTVTVTVVSSGCDGSLEQVASRSYDWG